SDPCAMLMMRVTPKIRERPAATKNSPEAAASPSSAWNRRPLNVIAGAVHAQGELPHKGEAHPNKQLAVRNSRTPARMTGASSAAFDLRSASGTKRGEPSMRGRGAQLPDLRVGRQHRAAIDIFEIHHDRLAVLDGGLADIGAHRRLVID